MKLIKNTLLAAIMLSTLAACNSDDSPKTTTDNTVNNGNSNNSSTPTDNVSEDDPMPIKSISGIISTGDTFTGTIYIVDNNGNMVQQKIDDSSTYEIEVKEAKSYLIKAVSSVGKNPNDTWRTLYSYSESGRANVTELTTYALDAEVGNKRLSDIFNNWKDVSNNLGSANTYAKHTLADFADELQQAGVTHVPNIFTGQFKNDGTGMDKALELINIFLMCTGDSCYIDGKTNGKLQTGEMYSEEALKNKLINVFSNINELNELTLRPHNTTIKTVKYDPASSALADTPSTKVVTHLAKPSNTDEFCTFYTSTLPYAFPFDIKDCSYEKGVGKFSVHNITDIHEVIDYTMTFKDASIKEIPVDPNKGNQHASVTRVAKENGVEIETVIQNFGDIAIPADEATFCSSESKAKYAFISGNSSEVFPIVSCSYSVTNKTGLIVIQKLNNGTNYRYTVTFSDNKPS